MVDASFWRNREDHHRSRAELDPNYHLKHANWAKLRAEASEERIADPRWIPEQRLAKRQLPRESRAAFRVGYSQGFRGLKRKERWGSEINSYSAGYWEGLGDAKMPLVDQ